MVNGHILDNIALYHPEVKYEEEKTLYRNMGQGRFMDATKSQGADFAHRAWAAGSPWAISTTTAGRIFW